ncbi:cobyric acid synthase [Aureibacter tunicatorum]|nr:cobyric acid synthase [Aureibacter tunicatorum]
MLVGTGSDVGKSVLVAGICRILKQEGYHPAPFKAQNMSLNSFATPEGLEIGRAQATQAEACGIPCHTDMNPVLLKPTSKMSSQVVLHGKPLGNQSAKDYFMGNNRAHLFEEVCGAYRNLSARFSPIVMEGAGSISELNLKHRDIVNMRMAKEANAQVYLVADIDRGGVFASVYGTIALLEEWERKLVKGIIINKFRGDASLFEDGKKKIEELTGLPVLGVVPFAEDIYIEDEDSVALSRRKFEASQDLINIGVVLLPHISNYTDFNMLERDERANLFYTREAEELAKADIIILPGSKNTIRDLLFLRKTGLAKVILQASQQGKKVVGICGGFQMMGEWISDPHGVESDTEVVPGLGILPVSTKLTQEKTTVERSFYFKNQSDLCKGYEIHMGETSSEKASPLNRYDDKTEGYLLSDDCWGSYMHGIFDNQCVIDDSLGSVKEGESLSYEAFKEENYDKLADLLRSCLDMEKVYQHMRESAE